jgi:hypothetical protein
MLEESVHFFSLVRAEELYRGCGRVQRMSRNNRFPPSSEESFFHAQEIAQHVLKNLKTLQEQSRHQITKTVERQRQYDGFSIRGLIDGGAEGMAMSPRMASAMVDFFQSEATAGRTRDWKTLQINHCTINRPFLHVLGSARAFGMFSQLQIQLMPTNQNITPEVVRTFCWENPALISLELDSAGTLEQNGALALRHLLDTKQGCASLEGGGGGGRGRKSGRYRDYDDDYYGSGGGGIDRGYDDRNYYDDDGDLDANPGYY